MIVDHVDNRERVSLHDCGSSQCQWQNHLHDSIVKVITTSRRLVRAILRSDTRSFYERTMPFGTVLSVSRFAGGYSIKRCCNPMFGFRLTTSSRFPNAKGQRAKQLGTVLIRSANDAGVSELRLHSNARSAQRPGKSKGVGNSV